IPLKPATIEFYDIAGLVEGASKGEGLGNKFLAHIRETDLICHVLRAFTDNNVVLTGKMDPVQDLQIVRMELILKDLETVEKAKKIKAKDLKEKQKIEQALQKIELALNNGKMLNTLDFTDEELEIVKPLCLLTIKPEIFAVNLSEDQISKKPEIDYTQKLGVEPSDIVFICAKIEAELSELALSEQKMYLQELGLRNSGIEIMAQAAYRKLNLISFLTVGKIEARAWSIAKGTLAPQAAGVIHTDFCKKFIKANVVSFDEFIQVEGWKKAKELGKVRQEGKDYQMQDGDVVEFMIGK
ncbi:redox-regulated ATPase YchF, partial [Candidatus Beckwithbacteria bacterium]|nr:redox-regulated ATPase YchF [Candidatus Beckwithbacteria bacterium]